MQGKYAEDVDFKVTPEQVAKNMEGVVKQYQSTCVNLRERIKELTELLNTVEQRVKDDYKTVADEILQRLENARKVEEEAQNIRAEAQHILNKAEESTKNLEDDWHTFKSHKAAEELRIENNHRTWKGRLEKVSQRELDADKRDKELDGKENSLNQRESDVKKREENVSYAEVKQGDRKNALDLKEKELNDKEKELNNIKISLINQENDLKKDREDFDIRVNELDKRVSLIDEKDLKVIAEEQKNNTRSGDLNAKQLLLDEQQENIEIARKALKEEERKLIDLRKLIDQSKGGK